MSKQSTITPTKSFTQSLLSLVIGIVLTAFGIIGGCIALASCAPAHADLFRTSDNARIPNTSYGLPRSQPQITAYIECWVGNYKIYKGQAVGPVNNEGNGYHSFVEAETGDRVNVGPFCIIRQAR